MLVNIIQTFDSGTRRYFAGENPDVDPAIAKKWIADGYASADTDGVASGPLYSGGSAPAQQVLRSSGAARGGQAVTVRTLSTHLLAGASTIRCNMIAFELPSNVLAARWRIQNLEATPPTGITARWSYSTTLPNPADAPTGGTWVNQTWAGATSVDAPAANSTAVLGLQGSNQTADWTFLDPVARTDGGSGCLVFLQLHAGTGNFTAQTQVPADSAALDAAARAGLLGPLRSLRRATVANAQTDFTTGTPSYGTVHPMGFAEFLLEDGSIVSIAGYGDSIRVGSQGIAGSMGAPALAAARDGQLYNGRAFSGTLTSYYQPRLLNDLATLPVMDAIIDYAAWSPNDFNAGSPVVTDALINAQKARLLQVLDAVSRRSDITEVRTPTPTPWAALNAAADAKRLGFRTWLLSLKHPKLRVYDIEGACSDGATPARFKVGLSDDGLHPNIAGYAAIAAVTPGKL